MTPERFRQIEELYHAAREAAAGERAAIYYQQPALGDGRSLGRFAHFLHNLRGNDERCTQPSDAQTRKEVNYTTRLSRALRFATLTTWPPVSAGEP
jgi:hypothetical protein